jgi:hypothetical protein
MSMTAQTLKVVRLKPGIEVVEPRSQVDIARVWDSGVLCGSHCRAWWIDEWSRFNLGSDLGDVTSEVVNLHM